MESRKISAVKFIDGGAPIFPASMIKSHRDIEGAKIITPLVTKRLRVLVASYIELAREKSPEDANPWATIIRRAPTNPQVAGKNTPTMRRAMCATEAYAIRDFMSGCRVQESLAPIAPRREILVTIG